MNMKTDGNQASPQPGAHNNAHSGAVFAQAATAALTVSGRRLALSAQPNGAVYRVQAKAAADATVTARILQCFVRNGQIPCLFLATLDKDGELSIEAWLRQGEIIPCALNRIVANIGAVIGVVSAELECELWQPVEICQFR